MWGIWFWLRAGWDNLSNLIVLVCHNITRIWDLFRIGCGFVSFFIIVFCHNPTGVEYKFEKRLRFVFMV